jgi:hypothetical protein
VGGAQHLRHERCGQLNRRRGVNGDLSGEAFGIRLGERAECAEHGIIDQARDRDASVGNGLTKLASGSWA